MKKLCTLLLCIILLTACGQKSLPSENKSPDVDRKVETVKTPEKDETSDTLIIDNNTDEENTTATEYISPDKEVPSEPAKQTVSIIVLGLDGEAVFSASAEYREGITAFSLLTETAEEKNIPVVFSGSKSSPYVTSICGLKEKQHGPSSGWVYTVNGEMVMLSSGKCNLNPDDVVEWKYIT